MPIYASAGTGTVYAPAPAGSHAAVCVDVVDLGVISVEYNGKKRDQHKINIVWQIDEDRDDGKPHQVRKRYTLSLHEKSTLRKDLESWRGRPFSDAELNGFDVEVLLHVGCLLNVLHVPGRNGGTYANVAAVMRLPKSMPTVTPRDYVRVCDREPEQSPAMSVPNSEWGEIGDDDVPF